MERAAIPGSDDHRISGLPRPVNSDSRANSRNSTDPGSPRSHKPSLCRARRGLCSVSRKRTRDLPAKKQRRSENLSRHRRVTPLMRTVARIGPRSSTTTSSTWKRTGRPFASVSKIRDEAASSMVLPLSRTWQKGKVSLPRWKVATPVLTITDPGAF